VVHFHGAELIGKKCIRQILKAYKSGKSVGYTVKTMENDFPISNYPLEQTEFLYDSKQGKRHTQYDYSMFRYRVVRLFFDVLHGMVRKNIQLDVALEFAILVGYNGQLKQNSEMEKQLFQYTIHHLKNTKMTKPWSPRLKML